MAIGPISSPATWNVGTVVAPAWCQGVQDNSNLFYGALGNGTLSAFSLSVDGVGNQATTPAPGQIIASGKIVSQTATSKTFWIPQGWGQSLGGQWTCSASGYWLSSSADQLVIPLLMPFNADGSWTITSIRSRVKPGSTGVMICSAHSITGLNTTGAITDSPVASGSSDGTANEQSVTIGSLSLTATSDKAYWLRIQGAQPNDRFYGALVTYTAPVF